MPMGATCRGNGGGLDRRHAVGKYNEPRAGRVKDWLIAQVVGQGLPSKLHDLALDLVPTLLRDRLK